MTSAAPRSISSSPPAGGACEWARLISALAGELPEAESNAVALTALATKAAGTEEDQEPDYSWRRKAANRRLQRCRGTERTEAAEDFVPVFATPRVQDGSPLFELPPAEVAERGVRGERGRARWEKTFMLTACIFAAVLTIMAWTTVLWSDGDDDLQAIDPGTMNAAEARIWAGVQRNHSRIPDARRAVEAFFRARTPEEKVPWVRGGDAMLPAMRRYYARHPDEPDQFRMGQNVDFGRDRDREFLYLEGVDALGDGVDLLVEDTVSGMKLDWKFLTGAGESDWADWTARQPCCPVSMRVEAVLDDYYSGPFSDAGEWLCLRITDAARTSALWAYVPRNSDAGLTIHRQLNERQDPVRMVGLFEFPAQLAPANRTAPQVYLRSVAPQGWMDRGSAADAPSATLAFFIPQHSNQP